ncbi:MAG: hypothetical protein ABSF54_17940 [Bryobacteraceae bacterium]|jgi:Flp pilus assembly pilin Flp
MQPQKSGPPQADGKGVSFLVELMRRFCTEDAGQDLIEYTLLMAFVTLASAALFVGVGTNVSKIWSINNATLSTAVVKATS